MNAKRLKLMWVLLIVVAGSSPAWAQRRGQPDRQPPVQEQAPPRERDRDAGPQAIPETRPGDTREESADGWGAELRALPPGRRPDFLPPARWWLGVYTYNTSTGVVITRVVPNSPAHRAGLERGDRIVTVGGYQVGYVDRYLYTLGAELQQRADRRGGIYLLIQDTRSNRLITRDIRLAPAQGRDRGFPLPGFPEPGFPRQQGPAGSAAPEEES